jgi:hypothetical protein
LCRGVRWAHDIKNEAASGGGVGMWDFGDVQRNRDRDYPHDGPRGSGASRSDDARDTTTSGAVSGYRADNWIVAMTSGGLEKVTGTILMTQQHTAAGEGALSSCRGASRSH